MTSHTIQANEASTPLKERTINTLGEVAERFAFEDNAVNVLDKTSTKIITGFGPTNAPTAGTLSVMFGVYRLHQKLNLPLTVIVSDLGAWNSRNLPWELLESTTQKMLSFLHKIYDDTSMITIRTHLDKDNLVRTGKIARFLTLEDMMKYKESLQELYKQHNLLGSDVGMIVDTLYTVADVLEPAEQGYENILMVSGFEEGYFVDLSKIVIDAQRKSDEITLNMDCEIGALFFEVIRGFGGYPKMSKSIPDSAANLNQSSAEIQQKLLSDDTEDQATIHACMKLASRWDHQQIAGATLAYNKRESDPQAWNTYKKEYLDEFLDLKRLWNES